MIRLFAAAFLLGSATGAAAVKYALRLERQAVEDDAALGCCESCSPVCPALARLEERERISSERLADAEILYAFVRADVEADDAVARLEHPAGDV